MFFENSDSGGVIHETSESDGFISIFENSGSEYSNELISSMTLGNEQEDLNAWQNPPEAMLLTSVKSSSISEHPYGVKTEQTFVLNANSRYSLEDLDLKNSNVPINHIKLMPAFNIWKKLSVRLVNIYVGHANRDKLIAQLSLINRHRIHRTKFSAFDDFKTTCDIDMIILMASDAIISPNMIPQIKRVNQSNIDSLCVVGKYLQLSIHPEFQEIITYIIDRQSTERLLVTNSNSFKTMLSTPVNEDDSMLQNYKFDDFDKFSKRKCLVDNLKLNEYEVISLFHEEFDDLENLPFYSSAPATLIHNILRRYVNGFKYTHATREITLCLPNNIQKDSPWMHRRYIYSLIKATSNNSMPPHFMKPIFRIQRDLEIWVSDQLSAQSNGQKKEVKATTIFTPSSYVVSPVSAQNDSPMANQLIPNLVNTIKRNSQAVQNQFKGNCGVFNAAFFGWDILNSYERYWTAIEFLLLSPQLTTMNPGSTFYPVSEVLQNKQRDLLLLFSLIFQKMYTINGSYPSWFHIFTLYFDMNGAASFSMQIEGFSSKDLEQDLLLFINIFLSNSYHYLNEVAHKIENFNTVLAEDYGNFLFENDAKFLINPCSKTTLQALANLTRVIAKKFFEANSSDNQTNDEFVEASDNKKPDLPIQIVEEIFNRFISIMTEVKTKSLGPSHSSTNLLAKVNVTLIPGSVIGKYRGESKTLGNSPADLSNYVGRICSKALFDGVIKNKNETKQSVPTDIVANPQKRPHGFLESFFNGKLLNNFENSPLYSCEKIISLYLHKPEAILQDAQNNYQHLDPNSPNFKCLKSQFEDLNILRILESHRSPPLNYSKAKLMCFLKFSKSLEHLPTADERLEELIRIYPNAIRKWHSFAGNEVRQSSLWMNSYRVIPQVSKSLKKDGAHKMNEAHGLMQSLIMKTYFQEKMQLEKRTNYLLSLVQLDPTREDKSHSEDPNYQKNRSTHAASSSSSSAGENKCDNKYNEPEMRQILALRTNDLVERIEKFLADNRLDKLDFDKLRVANN